MNGEEKTYPKFQFSRMLGGDQIVVRSENQEEIEEMIDWVKSLGSIKSEAMDREVDLCPTHNVEYNKSGTKKDGSMWYGHVLGPGKLCFKK